MKTTLWILLAAVLGIPPCPAQTKAPLRITVEKDQKTRQEVKQAQSRQSGSVTYLTPQVTERNREMTMTIKLQNVGASPMTALVVKYIVFGRDKQTRAIRPAGQGEQNVEVKPLETKAVKTNPVAFESQDVSYTQGYFADQNRAAGKDYYGIAVSVFAGDDKVASYFNPASLEEIVRKMNEEPKEKTPKQDREAR
jgi:hypothetical protein